MQYSFYFDVNRCAQCFACEVACKSVHALRPHAQEEPGTTGPRYRQVITLLSEDGAVPIQYVSMACMHCGDPACMTVCPAKAISRDPEFGVVLVDQDKCIGCRYCSWACRFGAPQFDRDGLMQKCDMCIDRLREGKQPACVESCCGGAITVGPVGEIETTVRTAAARKLFTNSLSVLSVKGQR
jgi:anaerobic dimethyl sulfoxide reductase subunit B